MKATTAIQAPESREPDGRAPAGRTAVMPGAFCRIGRRKPCRDANASEARPATARSSNRRRSLSLLPLLALLVSVAALGAADTPAPSSAYPEQRSFAQPIRPNPVGTNITATRAFLGAPPVMPHSFAGDRDGRYCLECHARVTRIEKRQNAIVPVPHAEYSQCQQCHVSGVDKARPVFRENSFVGLDLPGKGTRAHPLAPPTIPHKTFMRDNCLSCHGPSGKQRILSPHPVRSQCQQCHVPDASKNYDRPLPWAELDGRF